ncbi:hypothetical protein BGZ82_003349 [Podila clonocystis]|nr:hypothetical protein BGZ82_003349 [Podila clonocystis]
MAIGSEGMLNGAGMYEHYPATGDSKTQETLVHNSQHKWIDCSVKPPKKVVQSAVEPYACVSHTWGRYCCKGERNCEATGVYRRKHVCQWGKNWATDEEVYWDARHIVAAIVTAGWKGYLWLDWVDIPAKGGNQKDNKIKAQAELFADADCVYVFAPDSDVDSINEAIQLSTTVATCDDFVKLIASF